MDALDVDPTFADYEEDYNYCKAKGILEPHCELTPFTYDQSKWTRDYWAQLKVDLVENFSDERMSHMRQVAKIYLADKIKRLEREGQARLEEKRKQLEEENKQIAAQQAAQAERVAQAKQAAAQTQAPQGRKTTSKEADPSKKVIGVVAITIVVIGIVLFLILGHNPN